MSAIVVKDLYKQYGKREVVRGISFRVEPATIFGFIGKNGAGKSTTINMMTGIVFPTSGWIRLLGQDIRDIDRVKSRIGVMPDAQNYYGNWNALEHLRFFAKLKGIKSDKRYLMDLLTWVGLGQDSKQKLSQYSFGMKKKLSIAQALLGSPELLFLDEPTSGLDPQSAIEIRDLIQSLPSYGTTIFMTSHNLFEMEKLCDQVAILDKGVLVQHGSVEELKKGQQVQLTVHVKTNPLTKEQLEGIRARLNGLYISIEFLENQIELEITHENFIPPIVVGLCSLHIDVYQVSTTEVSLEDIFMQARA